MSVMGLHGKTLVKLSFILAALFFFLPFLTVSCSGGNDKSFSGIQLAFGSTISNGYNEPYQVTPIWPALIALFVAIIALIVTFMGKSSTLVAKSSIVFGAIGTVLMFIMRSVVSERADREGQGALSIRYEAGYTLVLLSFIASAVIGYFYLKATPSAIPQKTEPPIY